jgi:hypothetical protein
MKNFKLNPNITFVKGLEYLENCCKFKAMNPITSNDRLFPNGGIIVVTQDIILDTENVLPNIAALLEKNKSSDEDWSIKIHKITDRALTNFATSSPK